LRALRQGSARRDWPRRRAACADTRRRPYFAHHALRRHERVAPLWTRADGLLVEHALDTNGCGPTATKPPGVGRSASSAAGSPASRTHVTPSSASSGHYDESSGSRGGSRSPSLSGSLAPGITSADPPISWVILRSPVSRWNSGK